MKFHVLAWIIGGAISSLVSASLFVVWLMWPVITGTMPFSASLVPFLEFSYLNGPITPYHLSEFILTVALYVAGFGALLGFFGWLIFRPRRRKS